jgi:uncharacterized protein YndB with AHSA1/START domain
MTSTVTSPPTLIDHARLNPSLNFTVKGKPMSEPPTDELGSLDREGDAWRLCFVRHLPHSPERVWRALTEPAELSAWFPTSIEGERKAGAPLVFTFPAHQAPPFEGELLSYDPPRVLELMWGPERLRFELVATPEGTKLTLLNTFAELGKAARDAAGWHVCLDALAGLLAGGAGEPTAWGTVHARYVERFGPQAATIGPPAGFE